MKDADDCPGEGQCHGCAGWCNHCGDVDTICHAERCDRHRCSRCNVLLTREDVEHAWTRNEFGWHTECQGCYRQAEIERLENVMIECAKRADDPLFHEDRANWQKATETYAWHVKRLMAGEWP